MKLHLNKKVLIRRGISLGGAVIGFAVVEIIQANHIWAATARTTTQIMNLYAPYAPEAVKHDAAVLMERLEQKYIS